MSKTGRIGTPRAVGRGLPLPSDVTHRGGVDYRGVCNVLVTEVVEVEEESRVAAVAEAGGLEPEEELDGLEDGGFAVGVEEAADGPDGVEGRGGDVVRGNGGEEAVEDAGRDPAGEARVGHGPPPGLMWTSIPLCIFGPISRNVKGR